MVHLVSQDLSIAGNRKGLAGERSGLFMEQIRIIKEMREADRKRGRSGEFVRCRYAVWENVGGSFSSNKGRDFQAVLTEFVRVAEPDAPDVPMPDKGKWPKSGWLYDELGGWSVAWRIHDAQFWGVPQRRKRIALVADFNGLTAPEILFDPQYRREAERAESDETESDSGDGSGPEVQIVEQGLPGNFEPGGTPGEGTAGAVRGGTEGASFYDAYQHHGWRKSDTSGTLTVGQNNTVRGDTPLVAEPILLESNQNHATVQTSGVCTTLPASMGMGGGYVPMVVGCDVYNQEITGDVAASLTAACGGTNTSGAKVLCLND